MKILLILLIIVLPAFPGKAANVISDSTSLNFFLSGNLKGIGSSGDSLLLYFTKDILDTYNSPDVIRVDTNGNFSIKKYLPIRKGSLIHIWIPSKKTYLISNAPVEDKDSIYISAVFEENEITQIAFSGRGSIKYQCQREIENIKEERASRDKTNRGNYSLDTIKQLWNAANTTPELMVLKKYKEQLPATVFKLLETENIGEIKNNCIVALRIKYGVALKQKNSALKDSIINIREVFKKSIILKQPDILALSRSYRNLLRNKEVFDLEIQTNYFFSLKDVYTKIKNTYSGPLRESLIIASFLNTAAYVPISPVGMDSLYKDAIGIIRNPELKDYVVMKLQHMGKGAEAYNFALPDVNGQTVHLADFKGKVVLMDIWFTGCPGCLGYSISVLEKIIYPEFSQHSDVVFVSISGDTDKSQWLQSVKEGKYTRSKNVNLYTGGLGFDHPFTRYYNFDGGPYFLLIDRNGKVVSGGRPFQDPNVLIGLIKDASKMPATKIFLNEIQL